MPYSALLCDLDGTLADSEPLHCTAWLDTLREHYGLHYDEHWFEQWVGTSDVALAEGVIAEHGLAATTDELSAAKRTAFHAAVRAAARSFPGVPEQLARLAAAGVPLAIATNSGRADADLMIATLGLDRYTNVSVTASDVARRKPHPDIYELAAHRLGVDPRHCIALEDSRPGGEAAKAAGCYLIGLTPAVSMADELVEGNAEGIRRAGALLDGFAW